MNLFLLNRDESVIQNTKPAFLNLKYVQNSFQYSREYGRGVCNLESYVPTQILPIYCKQSHGG